MMTLPTQRTDAAKSLLHLAQSAGSRSHLRSLLGLLALYMLLISWSWAGFEEGETAYKKKDYTTALRELRPLAEQGDAAAQFYMAKMYANGYGVPEDDAEAVKWCRKAAEQGHTNAQGNLGIMYYTGTGVAKDAVEAVEWFRKAAEQGHTNAQGNLGAMYAKGDGVAKDDVTAYFWFSLAVAQGNENASRNRDAIAKQMTATQIAEAQDRVRKWKPVKEQTAPLN